MKDEPTADIFKYNTVANSWEVISHMATPRRRSSTATLPSNRLVVMEGFINENDMTSSVEFVETYYLDVFIFWIIIFVTEFVIYMLVLHL